MHSKALSIYYALLMFVVGTALFVMYPSGSPELTVWQGGMKEQFTVALRQTIGDQPWFDDVVSVYDGISGFYDQSADTTMALLSQPESDQDIIYVYGEVYKDFAKSFHPKPANSLTGIAYNTLELPPMPANFMTQEPLYNIVPYQAVVTTIETAGSVAGASIISSDQPVNTTDMPWVTIQDNFTGQLYCLAVYNGTVNKYLGPCKNDYH